MPKHQDSPAIPRERSALRKRIQSFYRCMNAHAYWKCFQFLDPRLRDGRVDQEKYTTSLDEFRQYYGSVEVISIILDLHLDVEVKKGPSDFAYVLVVWKDSNIEFLATKAEVKWSENPDFVDITIAEDPWLKVRIDGREGWIHTEEDFRAIGLPQAG